MTELPGWADLSGKRFVITGAGSRSGIGFASALAIAELGGSVILTSQSERCLERARELRSMGYAAEAVAGDLVAEASAGRLFDNPLFKGPIDGLVNNAGMTSLLQPMEQSGEMGGLESTTQDALERSFARNFTTAFNSTRALLPKIRETKGRVINISSVTGPVMAMREEVGYATAKAALVGFTRALAVDEAKYGVCVNAVAPGWIATDSQLEIERLEAQLVPLGRSASAEEIGRVVAFLSSPASSYITGQLIVVDGGNSVAEQRT